ncbi:MAG TPA: ribonuclease D [Gemmatimonadales bacterium]|nr:ribonuclease D [Gemmatimonadales bacterium]
MPNSGTDLIATTTGLAELIARIGRPPLVALDTEAASFHRYSDAICLVQLSTRDVTAVIDPLAVPDLSGIGSLVADPAVEVVFHDADYDLRLLARDHAFHCTRLFDTRVAAQLLNEPVIGLAALLEKHLGVSLDKKFQRADWSLRPLAPGMLEYAASDTRHLPALRDRMRDLLVSAGRWTWAEEEFERQASVRWEPEDASMAFLRIKGSGKLRGRQLAVLREVYNWREETARRLDRASFRVVNPDVLLALALAEPRDIEQLKGIKGISPGQAERYGGEILAAVARACSLPEAEWPRIERGRRPPPDPEFDARLERLKAVRTAAAERIGLAPGVLCPNGTLEAIARAAPVSMEALRQVPELRKWQAEVVGPELLAAVEKR